MNKTELRAACKASGIKGYGKMTNAQMSEALQELEAQAAAVKAKGFVELENGRMVAWEVREGIRPPVRAKSIVKKIWIELCNMLGEDDEAEAPTIAEAKEMAAEKGFNVTNVTIEFYRWRKWMGL